MAYRNLLHCTSGQVTVASLQGGYARHNLLQRGLAFARPSSDLDLGNRALVDSQQKTAFKLRFLLPGASGRRQAEGFWPPEAVMDMLKKVDAMNLELEDLVNAQKPAAANAERLR